MINLRLTSIKVIEDLYHLFKFTTINTKMSFQRFTNRSMHLYLNDEVFKDKIDNFTELNASSGSSF